MLKKIIFIVAGVTIAVGTYGFMHVEKNTPQPVKAMAMVDWSMGNSLSVVPHFAPGQIVELTWTNLTDVTFKEMYVQDIDSYYWKPTFGPSVKAMEGKEVYITGYVIPVDYDENFYVVSRYPYANCYFCGGGGPESGRRGAVGGGCTLAGGGRTAGARAHGGRPRPVRAARPRGRLQRLGHGIEATGTSELG